MSLARFMEYAQDFEKTSVDDDWSRLARYDVDVYFGWSIPHNAKPGSFIDKD